MAAFSAVTLAALTVANAGVAAATGDHATAEPEPAAVTLRGCVRQTNGDFTVADPPGAMLTKPGGINNRGDILFKYLDADGIQRGAVLSRGVYRPIEFPGAAVTAPLGQNDRGDIVGAYVDAEGTSHGLLRDGKGRYVSIDHPDDVGLGTVLYSINDRSQTTGAYRRALVQPDQARQLLSKPAAATGGLLNQVTLIG